MQWSHERLRAKEDVIIVECVVAFDSDLLEEFFSREYTMEVLRISPTIFGEPVERGRKYMLLFKRGRLEWRPSVREVGVEASFLRLFARTMRMSFEGKFRAPQDCIDAHKVDAAVRKKMPVTTRAGKHWSCYQLSSRKHSGA